MNGLLDGINPLDAWASIPDIGPVYGHETAYTVGYVGGLGTVIVGSIFVGNLASGTSGLIKCGSLLHKGARLTS